MYCKASSVSRKCALTAMDLRRVTARAADMYLAHFGLREMPFGLTPDTSFFFACADYQEALNTLLIAVSNGEGFIKITGEVGTGKTLLCRQFLASIHPPQNSVMASEIEPCAAFANRPARDPDQHFVTAYIPNPSLTPLLCCWRSRMNSAWTSRRIPIHTIYSNY